MQQEKNIFHIIPHSHWDREWYMSFEQHRMRLVELFDALIETMENNPEYSYYHMDGQYIVIEDYLEIRPQMRDRLMKLIRDDRIQIGPWYVLQDGYLTSGEANVRNMLYGIKLCKQVGADPVMCGYFPDTFGNVSQMPQLLNGFGIDNAVFGRGIGSILEDNKVDENAPNNPSEIIWRSPDGSEVIGVMFVQWYHNAMELPTDKTALKERLDRVMGGLRGNASTPHLLGMNGCDHQPVQTNLHEAISAAREIYGDSVEIKQSNFKDLMDAIRPYKGHFSRIDGEINGQRTSGAYPLIDTASAHVKLKQKNHRGQNILERIAEPLSVIAMLTGDKYRQDELFYAWKKLMQNHPHDSICCCSCDEVTREMDTRFDKSYEAARFVQDEAMDYVMQKMDTTAYGDRCLTVFHTSPSVSFGTVTATVDYPLNSGIETLSVTTLDGTPVPCTVKKLGETFTYTLPKDRFRQAARVDRFEVTVLVRHEGVGYETYVVHTGAAVKTVECTVKATDTTLENEYISLQVESDGTVTMIDKRSGEVYKNNLIYEDTGDCGNLYNFIETEQSDRIHAAAALQGARVVECNDCFATLQLITALEIPAGKEGTLRTKETLTHTVTTYLTVTAGVPRVDVKTVLDNQSENHRVRALFVPEIQADRVQAEGQFDVVDREIVPHEAWKNPCYCQRIQAFFSLFDGNRGLLIGVRGLNEYEILCDGKNTMALTLLRAVDHIGDWGDFPTPDGQCKGLHEFSYCIVPFSAATRAQAYDQGFLFNGDTLIARSAACHAGSLPAASNLITVSGDYIVFSALKKAEKSDSIILRVYNANTAATQMTVRLARTPHSVYEVNLAEERQCQLQVTDDTVTMEVGKKKIVTLELEFR